MVVSLQLQRDGQPVAGFLGLSSTADCRQAAQAPEFVLGSRELSVFKHYQFSRRKSSYLMGRIAVKRAVARLLDEPELVNLEVLSGVFHQPVLHHAVAAAPEISLAHSHGLAVGVAAPQGHPIGVDVEFIEAGREEIFGNVFTPEEFAMLANLAIPAPTAAFTLWTIKEAVAKVLRCGLTTPGGVLQLKAMEISGTEGRAEYCRAEFENFPQYKAHSWVIGGYSLSIVIPKHTLMGFEPDEAMTRMFQNAAEEPESI